MHKDATGCIRLHQNAPDCTRMQQNALESIRMQHDAPECTRMKQDAPRCTRMHQNAAGCIRIHQNAPECTRMPEDARECTRMYILPGRSASVLLASPLEELPLYSSQVGLIVTVMMGMAKFKKRHFWYFSWVFTGPEGGAPRSSFWTSGEAILSIQEGSKRGKLQQIF